MTTRKSVSAKRLIESGKPVASVHSAFAEKKIAIQGKDSPLFVNSVDKAMRVLLAFDGTQPHLSLSQIADRTDLDLSSSQRFIYTLMTLGYLIKDPYTKKYELSPKLLDFSYRYLAASEMVLRATPYIQQLSEETEEATNLTVLDNTDIVYAMRVASRHMLAPNIMVGMRIPAYCTAPGLAMLSRMPMSQAASVLQRSNLIPYTVHTVSDIGLIEKRLASASKAGFVRAEGEYYLGDISTAAAIVNGAGSPIGAVNISVSKSRWNRRRDEKRFADLVMSAAAAISGQRH
jgi:IclR family transcriptional regulator, pca regulon regulatory protein